ncbi:MAG: DNA polymerase III subunit gamma/tau [Microbacter sp.]
MNNFIVSARKYRPATFSSVVGQSALVTTLKNAIKSNHLAHAYLFCGPRGVGKTSCARIFAKTINCEHLTPDYEACNECESCRSFNEQRSYNIHELDAASNNSVDDIRSLIDQVRIPPQIGRYSVYIIDEVHMLSAAAFNAFLKTLEEPPAHAIFILATTEKHKIIPTILSRCQIYDFSRISINDMVEHLMQIAKNEGIHVSPEALNVIAQKADGGMRDALSIFDQIVSFCGTEITYQAVIENLNVLDYDYYFRLTDCFLQNLLAKALLIFNEILNKGFEAQNFVNGLARYFRDLLMCKDPDTVQLLEVADVIKTLFVKQAAQCSAGFLFDALSLTNQCDLDLRTSRNKRLLTELLLIKLCQWNDPSKSLQASTDKQRIEPISLAKTAVNPIQNATTPRTSSLSANEMPKAATPAPTVKSVTPPPSISIYKKAENDSTYVAENVIQPIVQENRREPVTLEKLHEAWLQFANEKLLDKPHIKPYMLNQLPSLDKEVIQILFEQPIQQKSFNEISASLKSFLKAHLKNDFLTFDVKMNESETKDALFTAQDRYAWLSNKNGALTYLRKEFKLEMD